MTFVLGHRGAPRVAPENTMEAFSAAARLGADGIELDVRRTGDGVLVVHHDPALPDGRLVVETARTQLPAWVPDLVEVLDAWDGRIVNVEVKHLPGEPDHDPARGPAAAVAHLLAGRDGSDRVVVSSFDLAAIDRVRDEAPGLATGLLTLVPLDDDVAADVVGRCAGHGHAALHPHHLGVTPALVARCRDAGLAVNTWTVDEPDRVRQLADMGVDAVISNAPDVALAALGR